MGHKTSISKRNEISRNRGPEGELPLVNIGRSSDRLRSEILLQAPRPGSLILVDARFEQLRGSEFAPALLSAIDARTHLQIARLYVTTSIATSLDFADYVLCAFPFPPQEIRTQPNPLFGDSTAGHPDHRFTRTLLQRNVRHVLDTDFDSTWTRYFAQYFFSGLLPDCRREDSINVFLQELRNYLYFHNNHRSFSSLGDQTAFQMLEALSGHSSTEVFDPFDIPSWRQG